MLERVNIVDSGARYKVYEPIHTSDRLTGHRWLTRVTRDSPRPLSPDQALLAFGRARGSSCGPPVDAVMRHDR